MQRNPIIYKKKIKLGRERTTPTVTSLDKKGKNVKESAFKIPKTKKKGEASEEEKVDSEIV